MRPLFCLCLLLVAVVLPARADTVLDRSVERGGAKVLELEAGGAQIVLTPSSDPATIQVRVDQDRGAAVPSLQSVKQGNRLTMSLKPPSSSPLLPFLPVNSVTYAISYPSDMRLDLRLSNGNVQMSNPSASVEIYDENGNVSIDGPRAAVTVESARGSVSVTGALAPIDLAADGGDVTATLASGWSGNEIRMQSATGSVRLTVPKGFRGKIDASSDSGAVHNELGSSSARTPFVWLYAPKGDVYLSPAK